MIAGTYTVTITDFNSCTRQRAVFVGQPTAILSSVSTTTTNCGFSNGTATVSASGGTGTLSYLWNTGASTTTITGLSANSYTVNVTDGNGCTSQSVGIVSSGSLPTINSSVVDSVACNGGNDGAITITISGGTPTYTFLWSNGAITQNISSLAIGTYTVTVTDQNSCTTSGSYIVSEPALIQATFTNVNATCGLANGSSRVNPTGGIPGYSYFWSNGITTKTISSIAAGTYTVIVTDFNFCTRSFSTVIAGTSAPVIDSTQVTNVLCNGDSSGSITVFASGGTPTLTYLWSNGGTTSSINNLKNGNFTVTVTDAAGCTVSQSYTITHPTFLAAPVTTQPSFCGQANGQATVNPSGGVSPYTFLWSNGQTTQTATGLIAGTYTVTITNSGSACPTIATITINQPSAIAAVDSVA